MKTIGILGGVGPEATADLFMRIVRATPANKDQDHIPIVMINNPQIPDRTKGILYDGEDPFPALLETAKSLEKAKVNLITIPCNTAHHFIDKIQIQIQVPIVNMIKETALFIRKNYPEIKNIGLVATTGTIKTRIYHDEFRKHGLNIITPNELIQETVVMDAIYGKKGIKAGFHDPPKKQLEQVGRIMINQGAEAVIAGCTEVSLVLKQMNVSYLVIDAMTVLAENVMEKALSNDKASVSISTASMQKIASKAE